MKAIIKYYHGTLKRRIWGLIGLEQTYILAQKADIMDRLARALLSTPLSVLGMLKSGSELKFEPELFRTGPKFGPKFSKLLDWTFGPVQHSGSRVKFRTCLNLVRTEPMVLGQCWRFRKRYDNENNKHLYINWQLLHLYMSYMQWYPQFE